MQRKNSSKTDRGCSDLSNTKNNMDYLFERMTSNNAEMMNSALCNAWVMSQINYTRLAKRINEAYTVNAEAKVVLFEFGYDPKNNHFNSDFIPGTDTLVHTHLRSDSFRFFCRDFLTKNDNNIRVYIRRKVKHDVQDLHPFISQVVIWFQEGVFDDPEMPSLIPDDQTLE